MPNPKPRKILVTSALPYANGPLHLGHMLEFIQTDIWVRFQKMMGNTCWYICGEDAHGTPIMLNAEKQQMSPEAWIAKCQKLHQQDLENFSIGLDNFYTTHSPENQTLSASIYEALQKREDIEVRTIEQAYDEIKGMFLPDRYIKGDCPRCGAADQYGDNCEVCGSTYAPTELNNPKSALSGTAPILKQSEHYFFKLERYEAFLKDWSQKPGRVPAEVQNKLAEWFESGLRSWDISRDAPYFGFPIPGTKDKFFYVWLDAPIGYMASFQNLCQAFPETKKAPYFADYWSKEAEKNTELYHFIGKDIIYFHALFWPAILHSANYRTPTGIFAHGFLTINGQKMSKSRGTFITASDYLKHAQPEYLRYYFASKLNAGIEDLDLNWADFVQRNNSDLVGKLVNIASRSAKFIHDYFDNILATFPVDPPPLYQHFLNEAETVADAYEIREYAKAVRTIMGLCDKANQYIDEYKPWILIKSPETRSEAYTICSLSLNLFRILMIYLSPILPELAAKTRQFLNTDLSWDNLSKPLDNHRIQLFSPMLRRLDKEPFSAMSTPETSSKTPAANIAALTCEKPTGKSAISIDDFAKVDLRIAKILSAEAIPEADKLLKLSVDIGEENPKQIFAGIKAAFPNPEELVGKHIVVVANLEPRKMRFGVSEGMMLVAGSGDGQLWLVEPQIGALPGMPVK